MTTGTPPTHSTGDPRPDSDGRILPPRHTTAAPASGPGEPITHFPPGTFTHAPAPARPTYRTSAAPAGTNGAGNVANSVGSSGGLPGRPPVGPPNPAPGPVWSALGQRIDSWADAQVDRAHRAGPPAPTAPTVVIHDPPTPMVASTYRALSWLAAVFIGVPALLTLALMLYQYWVWYNTPFLRSLTATPMDQGYALGCALVASTIVVAFLRKGPWHSEGARVGYTVYYAVIAVCIMAAGMQLLDMLASVPPDLVGYLTALNLMMASAFAGVLGLVVLPFLPTANAYFTRRRRYLQTIDAIQRGGLSAERARQLADRPADPPSAVDRPRTLWIALAVMAAFLSIFLIRTIVQALTIIRLAESSGTMTVYFGDIPTPPQPAVFIPFVVVLVWLALTMATFSGSNTARTVLTALLVGAVLFGVVAVIDPQSGLFGLGEMVLAAEHPVLFTISSFFVAILGIAALTMLHLPDTSTYFRLKYLKENPAGAGDDIEAELSRRGVVRRVPSPQVAGPGDPHPPGSAGIRPGK